MHGCKTKTKAAVNKKHYKKSLGVRPQTSNKKVDEAKQKTGGFGGKRRQRRHADGFGLQRETVGPK
jgi:hypothetical protein